MADENAKRIAELSQTEANLVDMVASLSTKINQNENTSSSSIIQNVEKIAKKHMDGAFYYENLENENSPSPKLPEKFSVDDLP